MTGPSWRCGAPARLRVHEGISGSPGSEVEGTTIMRERLAVTPRAQLGMRAALRIPAESASWVGPYLRATVASDAIVALVAALTALRGRYDIHDHVATEYVVLTAVLPVIWVAALALASAYDGRVIGSGADEFRRVFNAGLGLTSAIAILAYTSKIHISRSYLFTAMPLAVGMNLFSRYLQRKRLHRRRALGACMRRAVAVGHLSDVMELIQELRREPYHGLSVVATCLAGDQRLGPAEVAGTPVHGGLDQVIEAVREADADMVAILACPEMNAERLRRLAWELEKTRTDLCLAPALLDVAGPRTTVRATAGLPLLYVDHPDLSGIRQVIKSAVDKAGAMSALVLLAPFLLAVAVAIRFEDGGPVLFRQIRMGKDGRPFRLYKFRTMVPDAEQKKAALASLNEVDGVLFKIRNDPRVTRTGAWLRRWSIDEIPQLINVLRGEMSLVGPRPWAPVPYQEAVKEIDHARRRLAVRPGLTGLWQVSGRADLSWKESVRLDMRYVENWSFALDLQILWKTGKAVFRGSGAY
jgi:exopolysaccharide biosynthesis polyprenyl glycosylphosphotransferase